MSSKARPILERLAFVIYLSLLVGSIGVTSLGAIIGCVTGDFRAMFLALIGLVLSRAINLQGYAHWNFGKWEDSFNFVEHPGIIPTTEQEDVLFEEITALFSKMGEEQDVWARGEFRREIGTRLAKAPALREQFADEISRYPGL